MHPVHPPPLGPPVLLLLLSLLLSLLLVLLLLLLLLNEININRPKYTVWTKKVNLKHHLGFCFMKPATILRLHSLQFRLGHWIHQIFSANYCTIQHTTVMRVNPMAD